MVETILLSLASKVLLNLGSLAFQDVGLGWDLEDKLKKLEGTLWMIKAALVDAERKFTVEGYYYSIGTTVWHERLQDACYEADNVVDEFQYEDLRRQVLLRMHNHRSIGMQKLVRIFFSCSHTLAFRIKFKMGRKIEKIIKRLDMIADDRIKFHPIPTDHIVGYGSSSVANEKDLNIMGRDNDTERMLQLLIMSPSVDDDNNISVIPIVGIGGLGKTSLVRLLYNHEMVAGHFQLRIWVFVGQDFKVKHVIQTIIRCITYSPHLDHFSSNQLLTILGEKLYARRFLLVLDDVRNCDNRDWAKFFTFLTDGAKGSKIVVTTRNKLVASTVGTVPMYNLKSLSDEHCHELLLKWSGLEEVRELHVNLLEISKEIAKKCHGLPLASKSLGNLMFRNTNENQWLRFKDKELWELGQGSRNDIFSVLRLSYDSLPTNLKRCFLYCSIFPKKFEIEIDKLIQLWIAQGFILSSSGLNHELEDIGTDYLNQLCSIFFLEAIEQRRSVLNTCRMPEIIHDLAVFLAKVEFLNTANFHSGPISKMVKHVSFRESDCSGEEEVTKSLFKLENMRTVLFPFQGVGADKKGFVDSCISNFKYLHVLDLSNSCFQVLPRSIGNLKHLRFLDLSGNANIETLPNAICKLYNLETLRIWYCVKIQKLPKNIDNLISLRHLYLTTQQSCLPEKEIQRLTSLQSFRITGCGNLTSLPEGMELLVALRTVTISECPNLTCLPSTMKNLAKLENLDISNCPNLNLTEWEDFRGLRRLQ